MEIERKFLIERIPVNLEQYEKKEIEQGYLCTKPVVRIRKSNENYYLTYKSRLNMKKETIDHTLSSEEVELPLTKEAYLHLREKVDNHLITKTRYMIPIEGDLIVELDVFHGCLEGLVFAEVEFASIDQAKSFTPPEWLGKDVTSDKRYKNNYLATINGLDDF